MKSAALWSIVSGLTACSAVTSFDTGFFDESDGDADADADGDADADADGDADGDGDADADADGDGDGDGDCGRGTYEGNFSIPDDGGPRDLEGYTAVNGSLSVRDPDLSSLDGLECLQGIEGNLEVSNGIALMNLDALGALRTVAGALALGDNGILTDLDGLAGLTAVGGSLSIRSNASLTNIGGLDALASLGSDLEVVDNTLLPACQATALANRLAGLGWVGSSTIQGNDDDAVCE